MISLRKSIDVHHLLYGKPLATLGCAGQTNLASVGEWPPLVLGGEIFRYGGEVGVRIGADVFKMAHEKTFSSDFGDIDIVVADVRLGDGGADLGPDIGVEFAVFLLLLWAELDNGAVVFHFLLGGGFGSGIGESVDGFDFGHGLTSAQGKAKSEERHGGFFHGCVGV